MFRLLGVTLTVTGPFMPVPAYTASGPLPRAPDATQDTAAGLSPPSNDVLILVR